MSMNHECVIRLLQIIGLSKAEEASFGHICLGVAAVLGCLFVGTHFITVVITCVVEGFDWGMAAWMLDMMGFIAGAAFAFICKNNSNKSCAEGKKDNLWICVWAVASFGARILDTMMLFGVVKLSTVYITPSGAILASNIVSEVLIGNSYTISALVGSVLLLQKASEGKEKPVIVQGDVIPRNEGINGQAEANDTGNPILDEEGQSRL